MSLCRTTAAEHAATSLCARAADTCKPIRLLSCDFLEKKDRYVENRRIAKSEVVLRWM